VRAAVEQEPFAFAGTAETALAGRIDASGSEQPSERFATERKTFDLLELFAEVVVVEPA
jgi:hypothetical protein